MHNSLALKANHPTLYNLVQQWFETAQAQNFHGVDLSYAKHIETGHHRREIREVWTVPVTALPQLDLPKIWAGLQSLVMVIPVRHLWNKTTREVKFYLTSLHSNAQLIGQAIRKHWGIENQAHWTLDCTFGEDACRKSSFHSPRNFAILRRIGLNALNREQTYKRSLRQKMKRTSMDNDYMMQVLSYCFIDSTLDSLDSLCQP
ncbi:ISAs1 family transposase [Microcoleus sp. AT9_B5]